MKRKFLIKIATVLILLTTGGVMSAMAGDLTIRVSGAKNNNGRIMVVVGNVYGELVDDIRTAMVEATTAESELIIRNLPEGEHSVYVFHDENSNYKLDMNSNDVPTEDCYISKVNIKPGLNFMEVKMKSY